LTEIVKESFNLSKGYANISLITAALPLIIILGMFASFYFDSGGNFSDNGKGDDSYI